MRASGQLSLHQHVWHEKNGPHDSWSWEIWVEHAAGLGAALLHFMTASGDQVAGLHLAAHADTGEEYTDHSARLCWVGPPDALDVDFFVPPAVDGPYLGPRNHVRETTPEELWSMGESWNRRADGTVDNSEYGAMDRGGDGADPTLPALFLPHGSPPIPIEPCASSDWLVHPLAPHKRMHPAGKY